MYTLFGHENDEIMHYLCKVKTFYIIVMKKKSITKKKSLFILNFINITSLFYVRCVKIDVQY